MITDNYVPGVETAHLKMINFAAIRNNQTEMLLKMANGKEDCINISFVLEVQPPQFYFIIWQFVGTL